jgi:hypothetical protein
MPGAIGQFLNDIAGGFFGNDYVRDYTHASKTFKSGYYQNAPKFKFLFHVYFDVNTDAFETATSLKSNFGILVKSVKLPSFNFTTHELNQYNRKRIVQTKIKYDPIDITFHDDNNNLINSLWYRYYTYYYSDGTKPKVMFAGSRGGKPDSEVKGGGGVAGATAANYNSRTQYQPSISGQDDWGYIGETNVPTGPNPIKLPFFKNITVFGLSQHNFIAYTLVNPIITRFGHDTYNYDEGGGVMQNSMSVDYETVVYNQGSLDGNTPENIVTGFGDKPSYDRKLSPIATPGSNSNILGSNGLVAGAGGAMSQLAGGNFLGAIKTAGSVVNGLKNVSVNTLKAEVTTGIQNALNNADNPTRTKLIDIPIYGATPSNQGTAGAPPVAQQSPTNIGPTNNAGSQNNTGPTIFGRG